MQTIRVVLRCRAYHSLTAITKVNWPTTAVGFTCRPLLSCSLLCECDAKCVLERCYWEVISERSIGLSAPHRWLLPSCVLQGQYFVLWPRLVCKNLKKGATFLKRLLARPAGLSFFLHHCLQMSFFASVRNL